MGKTLEELKIERGVAARVVEETKKKLAQAGEDNKLALADYQVKSDAYWRELDFVKREEPKGLTARQS